MIYQEINLPIWGQLVLMVLLILIGIELAKIKPKEDVKQETKETNPQTTLKSVTGLIFNHRDDIIIKETDYDG